MFNKNLCVLAASVILSSSSFAYDQELEKLENITVVGTKLKANQIEIKNDGLVGQVGQAYVQAGFVANEKAGVWLQVPSSVKMFKPELFRVLFGSAKGSNAKTNVFFQADVSPKPTAGISGMIQNAADISPGNGSQQFFNDIPLVGADGESLPCIPSGQYFGGAIEFTHSGLPSVFRDVDGLSQPTRNLIYGVPGGWKQSVLFGVRGDWIMRVVGHEALPGECD